MGALLLSLLVLSITSQSLNTFERDVPRAKTAEAVQLALLQAQIGTFEVLAGDADATAQSDVYPRIDSAMANCIPLASGGTSSFGRLEPMVDIDRRDTASLLCVNIDTYSRLTRKLIDNPVGRGEGTEFDQQIDVLLEQMLGQTQYLSDSLGSAITADAGDVRRLGQGMGTVIFLLGLGVALLGSRQRRLVAEQTQQLANFAALVHSSGDAIISLSLDGDITSWNAGAEHLFGYWSEEIIGAPGELLVRPEGRAGFAEVWLPVSRGERTLHYEARGTRSGGAEVPIALTLSPILDSGLTVVGVSVIARDITSRIARDEELANARNKALEASRLKSQFLATMSHEIRTPLNGVLGLNALLLQTSLTETQRQYAEGVDGAGVALLSVINDILDFSKLEAGKVGLDLAQFDPRAVLDEVAGLVAVPAHGKGLELLAFCSPDVPTGLVGDGGRIRQVLLNLAANAVKFTASGEVVLTVTLCDLGEQGAVLRFEVRDTGIGIAEDGQQAVFESFSQADATTTRRFGGTGLGLAISQRLVEAMGGTIGLDSVVGRGSTFWFELPLPLGDLDNQPAPSSAELMPGLRVLVVDDNATNRLILVTQLTAWQLLPEAVGDAETALVSMRTAAAAGHPFDIAVLDLLMPDVDGLELARRKLSDPALSHTRLLLLTSTAYVDSEELLAAGISQWCTKPARTSVLYDRLSTLMSVNSSAPSRPALASGTTAAGSRGRVLVAEDNEINQMVAEGILTMLGFDVEMVPNGAEALAALTSRSYAAVLMDCHMPVMDGFEATRQIRAIDAGGPRIPIIAMTAGALSEDRDRCLAAGMDAYVSKPVTVEALDEALSRWAVQHV